MHIPLGFWKDGFGDIDVIAHDGVLHAFYLCIPSHDRVGHLTSTDGLRWVEQPFALHTGNPGEFDDDQIWTMGVFRHDDRFFMLYTGLSMRERGKVQRIGLATSEDLMVWQKHKDNPVLCVDPVSYDARYDETSRVDWRDPFVYAEGGILHGVLCARALSETGNRMGAAGYFISTDGYHWTVKPPLCVPGNCYDFETPALCKIKGRYYLTGICGQNAEGQPSAPSIFRVAERPEGPYRRVGAEALLPGDNQVFKPCSWEGNTLYFHNLSGIADWPGGGRCRVTCLAPPKIAETDEAGALIFRPFKNWDSFHSGPPEKIVMTQLAQSGTMATGMWRASGDAIGSSGQTGFEAFLLAEEYSDMIAEMEIENSREGQFGFLVRGDASADECTFISLDPQLRRVQVYSIQTSHKTPGAGVTYAWRGRRVVQEWICPWEWGNSLQLRIVLFGPYCEVSLDDRVVISALTQTRQFGRVGFFAEDASPHFRNLSIRRLNPPPCMDGFT